MTGVYYTLYDLLAGVLYGTTPAVDSFEAFSLSLLSTCISFVFTLLPFFIAFWVLKLVFRVFSWGS